MSIFMDWTNSSASESCWLSRSLRTHSKSFSLPLPLGVESRCESFDFRLTEEVNYEEVRDRLNAVLPEDLWALRAAAPVMEPGAICWADYRLTIRDEDPAAEAALERFLRGLTPEERILFLRRYWWAEPLKTAAAHCGIPARRAKSILERLRRALRSELEKEEITL